MGSLNIATAVSGGGLSISRSIARSADSVVGIGPVTLPVGKAGTLTTRTDANTGTITMSAGGHGITTGMIVDVHWPGGVQYKVTVGTVSGTSVPIDLGIGDNLPIATSAVVVTPRVQINASIDGDLLYGLAIEAGYTLPGSTAAAHIEFLDGSNAQIAELDLLANNPKVYDVAGGSANPFTGNVIVVGWASNGSATEEATLQLIYAVDATP